MIKNLAKITTLPHHLTVTLDEYRHGDKAPQYRVVTHTRTGRTVTAEFFTKYILAVGEYLKQMNKILPDDSILKQKEA